MCVCVTFLWTPETKALSFFFYFCKMAFVTLVKLMIFKETIAFRWPLIRKKQRQNLHNVPKRLFLYINLFCSSLQFAILGSNQSFKSKTPLIWQLFYQTLGISKKITLRIYPLTTNSGLCWKNNW